MGCVFEKQWICRRLSAGYQVAFHVESGEYPSRMPLIPVNVPFREPTSKTVEDDVAAKRQLDCSDIKTK